MEECLTVFFIFFLYEPNMIYNFISDYLILCMKLLV